MNSRWFSFALLLALVAVPHSSMALTCPNADLGAAAIDHFNAGDYPVASAFALAAEVQHPFAGQAAAVLAAAPPAGRNLADRLLLQIAVVLACFAASAALTFAGASLVGPSRWRTVCGWATITPLLVAGLIYGWAAARDRVIALNTLQARVLPDAAATVVGVIPGGSAGHREQVKGGYALVRFSDVRGWVISGQLAAIDELAADCR